MTSPRRGEVCLVDLGMAALLQADRDQPPVRRQQLEVAREVGGADGVEDHVRPVTGGLVPYDGHEVPNSRQTTRESERTVRESCQVIKKPGVTPAE